MVYIFGQFLEMSCICNHSLVTYLYFICYCCSPSGCTFWGKKPWSRKKKILWQMGTLIGAPLGIALAAGVVLPAMVIGIPVYVGRQVRFCYGKLEIQLPIGPEHSSFQLPPLRYYLPK